jgi:transcriptional regulator with PAS, ATPase and Fis domain
MDFIDKLDAAVTVTDENDIIIYMNDRAKATFEKSGGGSLIGKSLADCHSEASREKIREIKRTGKNNIYTIEKNGRKKLIFQTPRMSEGKCLGLVELSVEIPFEMPHFIRE